MYAGEIKKSVFTRAELPAARARRAAHALRRQPRSRRRHGALLRALGDGQDDAFRRPAPPSDRRRRARLERARRLQLRGRLLRQGDPPVGERRAADRASRTLRLRSSRTWSSTPGPGPSTTTTTRSPRTRGPRTRWATSAGTCASGLGGHPRNVFFLACDAYGVLPPIARLTPEMASYHFLSGFTAKLAGTETGVTEPKPTFSACFGAPFMPRPAVVYAEMLAERLRRHGTACWLVNTGWSGGPTASGRRMKIALTRRLLRGGPERRARRGGVTPRPGLQDARARLVPRRARRACSRRARPGRTAPPTTPRPACSPSASPRTSRSTGRPCRRPSRRRGPDRR